MPDSSLERITETHPDRISLVSYPGMYHSRDMTRLLFKKVGDMMRIIGILTALAISFASPSKIAATLERDTTSSHLRLPVVSHSSEGRSGTGFGKISQNCKEMLKRTRFLLQVLDKRTLGTSFGLLRSATSQFSALLWY